MIANPMPGTCAGCGRRVWLYSTRGWYEAPNRPHRCSGGK